MRFASLQDVLDITNEMPLADRNLPASVYEMLAQTAQKFPDRPALSFQLFADANAKARTLNWAQMHDQVVQAANLFRSLGIGEGDVVALVLPNCAETAVATVAGMVAGIVNPINPLLEPDQIAAILRQSKARVVVTLRAFPKTDIAQKTAQAVAQAPDVQTVLEIDLNSYLSPPKSWIVPLVRPKVENPPRDLRNFMAEAAKQPKTLQFAPSTDDRIGAYFHTGGTTGMPKLAQHLQSGMVYQGWLGDALLFSEEDVVMCPLPLFHVFATHVIFMAMMKSGAHVIFPTPAGYRGDGVFDQFWKLCERWRITFIITVPTAVSALMQRPVDADLSTVKNAFSGSAPMPLELFNRFTSATGINIIEGYGLTEATCLVSCNPLQGEKRVGSVGVPFPYNKVRIIKQVDGTFVECATDEIGEICVAGPGVWSGNTYSDASKNVDLYVDHEFLRTGDLGRIDADGYIWITGRAKDLIIRGGHNIDPALIEEALLKHNGVAFAGAIGQPDIHAGELPCVYVELVTGADVSIDELADLCKTHIPEKAAIPKHIEVLEALPKTAVGKVFKPDLRKMAIVRVLNAALADADVDAQVKSVEDDKTRGFVAKITGADRAAVATVLDEFAIAWDMAAGE